MTDCMHRNTAVYDSRPPSDNCAKKHGFECVTVRRRECLDCGYSFKTFELSERQLDEIGKQFMKSAREKLLEVSELILNWKL